MRVYVLQFSNTGALQTAFSLLMQIDRTASCVAEPDLGRIRFAATPDQGEALVEKIYLRGGLSWCSRHELAKDELLDPAAASV